MTSLCVRSIQSRDPESSAGPPPKHPAELIMMTVRTPVFTPRPRGGRTLFVFVCDVCVCVGMGDQQRFVLNIFCI